MTTVYIPIADEGPTGVWVSDPNDVQAYETEDAARKAAKKQYGLDANVWAVRLP